MSQDNLQMSVSVKDSTEQGIRSVINHLQSKLPGRIGIDIETQFSDKSEANTFFKKLRQDLREAGNDANKTSKILGELDKKIASIQNSEGKSKYGENYATQLYNDCKKALNSLDIIENRMAKMNRDGKKSGMNLSQTTTYKDLDYMVQKGRLAVVRGDYAGITRVLDDLSSKEYASRLSDLGERLAMKGLPKGLQKNVSEYNRILREALDSGNNSSSGIIKKVLGAYKKDLSSMGREINEAAGKKGLKSPIADAENYIRYLQRASNVLDSFNGRIKEANATFGKDAAKPIVSAYESYKRQLQAAVRSGSSLYLRDTLLGGGIGAAKQSAQNARQQIELFNKPKEDAAKLETTVRRLIEKTQQFSSLKGLDLSKTIQDYEKILRLTELAKNALAVRGNEGVTPASQYLKKAHTWLEEFNHRASLTKAEAEYNKRAADANARAVQDAAGRTQARDFRAPGIYGSDGYQRNMSAMRSFYESQERQIQRQIAAEKQMQAARDAAHQRRMQQAQQYANKVGEISQRFQGQSHIVSSLRNELLGLYSIQQVGQFLRSIVQIGGQFEYQRAAISAILDDTSKANTLFNKIKDMALKSPFSTLDLDKYTKQLAAFDVPYNEMYTKLKQIGDISAATGTEMNRIIYAYGHVRSSGFMNAMQLRQFTNANIPMLPMLAELYGQRKGQASPVSRDEVYKMLTSHQVSLEDVEEVFRRLTEEGGRFANMQEVMADTVAGVWKNLGDAINHMYLGIEQSHDGILKGTGKTLTSLTKFVGSNSNMLEVAIGFWGAYKLAVLASSHAVGAGTAKSLKAASVHTRERVAVLELAQSYRILTGEEERELAVARRATTIGGGRFGMFAGIGAYNGIDAKGLRKMMLSGELKKDQILRGVATGKIGADQAMRLVGKKGEIGGITVAELTKANSALKGYVGTANRELPKMVRLQYAWNGAVNSGRLLIGGVGMALKGLMTTMLPMLAITAVIEGITWAMNRSSEAAEKQKEMNDALGSSVEGLDVAFDELHDKMWKSGGNSDAILEAEKEAVEKVKDNLISANDVLADIYKRGNDGNFLVAPEQRAKMLEQKLIDIKNRLKELNAEEVSEAFTEGADSTKAMKGTGDWLPHDLKDQIKYWDESTSAIQKFTGSLQNAQKKGLKAYIAKISEGKGYMAAFKDEHGQLNNNLSEQIKLLTWYGQFDWSKAFKEMGDADASQKTNLKDYVSRIRIVKEQMGQFAEYAKNNGTLSQMLDNPAVYQEAAAQWAEKVVGLIDTKANEVARMMTSTQFNIPLQFVPEVSADALKKDMAWRRELIKKFSKDGKPVEAFSAVINTSADIASARKACQTVWDEAAEKWKELQRVGKAFGIDINFNFKTGGSTDEIRKKLKKMVEDANAVLSGAGAADKKDAARAKKSVAEALIAQLDVVDVAKELQKEGLLETPKGENKNNSRKSVRDEALEALRKEEQQVNNLVSAYENLRTVMNATDAMKKLGGDAMWKPTIEKFLKNVTEITPGNLAKVYRDMAARIGTMAAPKGDAEQVKTFMEARNATRDELLRRAQQEETKEATRQMDASAKAVQRLMNKQKEMYDLYEKVRKSTGDRGLAGAIAFGSGSTGTNYGLREDELVKDLETALSKYGQKLQGEAKKYRAVDLLYVTDEDYEEMYSQLPPKIREIADTYREQYKGLKNERMAFVAELYGRMQDEYTVLQRAAETYRDTLEKINGSEGYTDEEKSRLRNQARATFNDEVFKHSASYITMYDEGLKNIARDLEDVGKKAKENLVSVFVNGGSLETMMSEFKRYSDVMFANRQNAAKSSFWSRVTGNGLDRKTRIDNKKNEGYAELKKAILEVVKTAGYNGLGSADRQSLINAMLTNDIETMDKFAKILGNEFVELAKKGHILINGADDLLETTTKLENAISGLVLTGKMLNSAGSFVESLGIGNNPYGGKNISKSILSGAGSTVDSAVGVLEAVSKGGFMNITAAAAQGVATIAQVITGILNDAWENKLSEKNAELENIRRAFAKLEDDQKQTGGMANLSLIEEENSNLGEQIEKLESIKKMYETDEELAQMGVRSKHEDVVKAAEIESQIYELQLKQRDLWKNLWAQMGLDLKQFASQLSDALTKAWENGEDAALAWSQTVGDVMRNFAKNWIMKKYLENFLAPIEDQLFGQGGYLANKNPDWEGALNFLNTALSYDAFMGGNGGGAEEFWRRISEIFPNSSSQGGTSGITVSEKAMTEGIGNVLAGYINAMRTDLSTNNAIAENQLNVLGRIHEDVHYMAEKMDAIDTTLRETHRLYEDVSNGTRALTVQ